MNDPTAGLATAVAEAGGTDVRTEATIPPTVHVAPQSWADALAAAAQAGAVLLDFLTAVDDDPAGVGLIAHVTSVDARAHLLVRTTLPTERAEVATITGSHPAAGWYERETAEMFDVVFVGSPDPRPLLLPAGAPAALRKQTVLVARQVVPWPGAADPADRGGNPSRRRTSPPGVVDGWASPQPRPGQDPTT